MGRDVQPSAFLMMREHGERASKEMWGRLDLALRYKLPSPRPWPWSPWKPYCKEPNGLRFCLSSFGMGFEMQTVAAGFYFSGSQAAYGSWGRCWSTTGSPKRMLGHISELPFTPGWPQALLIHSDLI